LSLYRTGETCAVFVTDAADFAGNGISAPVGGGFTFDFDAPEIVLVSPDTLYGPLQRVAWRIVDEPAGVSPESITLTANGIAYTLASLALSFDGEILTFAPRLAEPWHADAEISLTIADMAYACPNIANYDLTLLYMPAEPQARFLSPPSGMAIACDPLRAEIFFDGAFGVDVSSAEITCNGTVLRSGDLLVAGDSVFAIFPEGAITSGADQITVSGLFDTLGNEVPAIVQDVLLDFNPPRIEQPYPADGQVYRGENLIISVLVTDDFAGVSLDLLSMTFNGDNYRLESPLLQMRGDTLALDASSMELSGAVSVRVDAFDRTTLCGPNASSLSWDFVVNAGAPLFELVEPFDGAITHVRNQPIIISASDPDGILPSSILLDVNGEEHRIGSEMSFVGGLLEFRPQGEWVSGTIYNITIYGEDAYGEPAEIELGSFVSDFDPPEVIATSPENGAVLEDAPRFVTISIRDEISGFDPRSFAVEFDGRVFYSGDFGLLADSTGITFDLEEAGIVIGSPDSAVFKITGIADYAGDYGSANIAEDFTLKFTVVDEGCVATPRPFSPNGDDYYDVVTIFTGIPEIAEINIYTIEGRKVRNARASGKWDWDGNDNAGRPMPPGIYTYTVGKVSDGSAFCGGTIILAR
ncbi:MAG TPA: hypothetical protein ENN07_06270, partial [candidate division Zixibacteria bacterium]|nr:hypothetical protein [candidate division Zixibacteria bacterium]